MYDSRATLVEPKFDFVAIYACWVWNILTAQNVCMVVDLAFVKVYLIFVKVYLIFVAVFFGIGIGVSECIWGVFEGEDSRWVVLAWRARLVSSWCIMMKGPSPVFTSPLKNNPREIQKKILRNQKAVVSWWKDPPLLSSPVQPGLKKAYKTFCD